MTRRRPAPTYHVEALDPFHRLERFGTSAEPSSAYLRRQARNDVRTKTAAVFVLTREDRRVCGFYALTAHVTHLQNVWPEIARRLPRCPNLSTTLLQHLAIRRNCAPEWKEFLLLDALRRAQEVAPRTGSVGVVIYLRDQLHRDEEDFYLRYGFQHLSHDRFWLPMTTIAEALGAE